jgi:3-hydroxyacyl-[acyl-carrier-protein] dehydratase
MSVLTTAQIQELIPHRPPFLWIDEVVECDQRRLVARKYVDPGLDVFRGHYPEHPVLPGVLVCEAALQAGAVLIARLAGESLLKGQIPVATRLSNARFRRMVGPGDTLEIEVELNETLSNAYFLSAKVHVAGQVAASLEFACAVTRSG